MTGARTERYETFASTAGEYGVELTRTSRDDLEETIAGLVRQPAVGAPLPWEGFSLPDSVRTDPTPSQLEASVTGVTGAAFAIAEYGSFVLAASPEGSEPVSVFPDRHVVVLRESDIVDDMPAAFDRLGDRIRSTGDTAIIATGPSATADMGALVQGAHGPKAVHGVVVE